MKKIVLSGFIGCGKSTVGDYLVSKYGYTGLSFADSLKDSLSSVFCWDRELIEGKTAESRIWRDAIDHWWADKLAIPHLTPRWVLRYFGTDVMRKHFHPDLWLLNIERRILDLGDAPFVIFDARFRNELDLIKKYNGTSIRVKRGPEPVWYDIALKANSPDTIDPAPYIEEMKMFAHESEWAWIGYDFNHVLINDSDLLALSDEIDKIVG